MIILPRKASKKMRVLKSILRRAELSPSQRVQYEEQLKRLEAGYAGECRADRYWEELEWPESHYLFYNYETVNQYGYTHQIDTIFLTTKYLLIVEIKNIAGVMKIDMEHHQFLRTTSDGRVENFVNPVDQIERHEKYIHSILIQLKIKLPILKVIILTNPSSVIQTTSNTIPIFHLSGLSSKLAQFNTNYTTQIDHNQIEHIKNELMKRYQPSSWSPTQIYPIKKGIQCRNGHTMLYKRGAFRCDCGEKSNVTLSEALTDYYYLVNPTITNKELRDFLCIECPHAASKLLKKLAFPSVGEFKNRVYFIPNCEIEVQNKSRYSNKILE
ncbi:nuclease-related domain-containing protein [Solibacillus sp. CAU 1738]|uniref:nuclease-related domain-containing protein n=1 Tax=Solibacillus sp. CAU 1738 TaxID=3140363 RepID=UPI0032610123